MSLTEIIRNEIGTLAVSENRAVADFFRLWDGEVLDGASVEKEERYCDALTELEDAYFTQGFLRGIAAAKGGIV